MRVGVGVFTGQFNVIAFFAQQLGKFFRQQGGTLIVVGYDLGNCYTFFGDFAIDQEGRDPGVFGFLHSRHSRIGTSVVKNDRRSFLADTGLDQFHLLVGVIIMDQFQGFVSKFFRFLGSNFLLGAEERILDRRHDNTDQFLGAIGSSGSRGGRFSSSGGFFFGCGSGGGGSGAAACKQHAKDRNQAQKSN